MGEDATLVSLCVRPRPEFTLLIYALRVGRGDVAVVLVSVTIILFLAVTTFLTAFHIFKLLLKKAWQLIKWERASNSNVLFH